MRPLHGAPRDCGREYILAYRASASSPQQRTASAQRHRRTAPAPAAPPPPPQRARRSAPRRPGGGREGGGAAGRRPAPRPAAPRWMSARAAGDTQPLLTTVCSVASSADVRSSSYIHAIDCVAERGARRCLARAWLENTDRLAGA